MPSDVTLQRSRAWVEVRAAAVRHNLRTLAGAMRPGGVGVRVIPMVKADAYGLGVDRLVHILAVEEPWAWGVATVEEGLRLRELGVTETVLVMSPLPPGSYRGAVEGALTPCLSDLAGLRRLDEAASGSAPTPFHVEIDTGIGRAGFDWRETEVWGPVLAARHGGSLQWAGCFTHFHSADVDGKSLREQMRRFREALNLLSLPDEEDFTLHVANSAAALRAGPELPPVVRPGIFLYGGRAGRDLPAPEPVVSLRSRVVHVREAPPGTTVGYGATHEAGAPERWATLGVGYGDGLPRALGNVGHALLRGRRVPIVGRVSMDVTVVNISGVPGVEPGDVATLIGRDGGEEITVDEVAEMAGTIPYEILTGLTARLSRVWVDDGS